MSTTFCGDDPCLHYCLFMVTSQWVMMLAMDVHYDITMGNDVGLGCSL